MRLVQFRVPDGIRVGSVKDGGIIDLWEMATQEGNSVVFESMEGLIRKDGPSFQMTKELLNSRSPIIVRRPVLLLAPLMQPSKIICLGRNFLSHIEETGFTIPPNPILFSKFRVI